MNDHPPAYPPGQPAEVRVPREWVGDGRLRFRELGVLVAVAEGGTVTVARLARGPAGRRAGREGREAVLATLKRLYEARYVQRGPGRGGWLLTDQAAAQWRTAQAGRVGA